MDDAARSLIGRTLGGRFKLTSFIGEGGMAAVFRGAQDIEPRDVAVKVLHRGLSSDRSFVKRFQREARAAALIEHRNTVRILEHGFDTDVVYIAMELCPGQDLFEVLVRERRLAQARAARIVLQVCAALEEAHRHGVVHRDLKPENVMLMRDPDDPGVEIVKVLDFGIAKLLEKETDPDEPPMSRTAITLVGAVVGTPEYMSPEQARGNPPVDARSDVYACGVLLYQLVTGKLPFSGDSAIQVVLQQMETEPPPPSSILPALHPGLERIILTALAKWPEHRQQSARALADELSAILPELEAPGAPAPGDRVAAAAHHARPAGDEERRGESPSSPCLRPELLPGILATLEEGALSREAEVPRAPEAPSPWAMTPVQRRATELAVRADRGDPWILPWWVLALVLALVCTAICLTRYARFG